MINATLCMASHFVQEIYLTDFLKSWESISWTSDKATYCRQKICCSKGLKKRERGDRLKVSLKGEKGLNWFKRLALELTFKLHWPVAGSCLQHLTCTYFSSFKFFVVWLEESSSQDSQSFIHSFLVICKLHVKELTGLSIYM